jgi:linoleoyl-CoA desaturase
MVLRQRLDGYFAEQHLSKRADGLMAVKIAGGFTACIAAYALLYVPGTTSWQFVLLYVLHGLTQLYLLLNVAHDGNHSAISGNRAAGKMLTYTFDIFGINSYIWRVLHNSGHHPNINLCGEDEDVMARGYLRFSPYVPRRWFHRYQHFYAWLLYGFSTLDYVLLKDLQYFFFTRYQRLRHVGHPAAEYLALFLWKAFYFTYMLVLPVVILKRPLWLVVLAFVTMHFVVGLAAQFIFQTAHIIETSYFPERKADFDQYTFHVLATTADYSTEGRLSKWLLGGLNHHVAHHLCPGVCHTHYPQLTRIIRDTALEFRVPYREHRTIWQAAARHFRLLRHMGRQD